jgi:hypothetical protein
MDRAFAFLYRYGRLWPLAAAERTWPERQLLSA